MRRFGMLALALLALPVTVLAVHEAGRSHLATPTSRDDHLSAAAWHWRECQPHHWRDCLLQR